jgi:hypothetical protein
MDVKEIGLYGVHQSHLAHDRDQWQAHVNMVVNLVVP